MNIGEPSVDQRKVSSHVDQARSLMQQVLKLARRGGARARRLINPA